MNAQVVALSPVLFGSGIRLGWEQLPLALIGRARSV
jgi:hypothetical protein